MVRCACAMLNETRMPIRLKKLIGSILLVALVIVYALAATTIAAGRLAQSGRSSHLLSSSW